MTLQINASIGSIAALLSAASWAVSSILFGRIGNTVPPAAINYGKCILGVILLGALLLCGQHQSITTHDFLLLGASGLIGIALGDTLFFKALLDLGPRVTLILGTLGPVITILLAVLILKERPSALSWAGIIITLIGVNRVLFLETPKGEKPAPRLSRGIKFGLIALLCNSAAIIMAKAGVQDVSALQGSFIRFFWGMTGLTVIGIAGCKTDKWLRSFNTGKSFKRLFIAVLIAIFGGFFLFLLSLKYIDASIAAILNETTPLFILPLSAIFLKEKISSAMITAAGLAVSGVALIILG